MEKLKFWKVEPFIFFFLPLGRQELQKTKQKKSRPIYSLTFISAFHTLQFSTSFSNLKKVSVKLNNLLKSFLGLDLEISLILLSVKNDFIVSWRNNS